MAFDRQKFDPTGSGSKGALKTATYRTADDNLAAVAASGYFDDAATELRTGDFVMVNASDGNAIYVVDVSDGVVTVDATFSQDA